MHTITPPPPLPVRGTNSVDRSMWCAIAATATLAYGVITTRQLESAGLPRSSMTRLVRTGRLHRVHQGVYALGHRALARKGYWSAALLASGEGATLSDVASAQSWGITRRTAHAVNITTPRPRRPLVGVTSRSSADIERDTVIHARLAVTSVTRTIADLARHFSVRELTNVMDQADFQGQLDMEALDAFIARCSGRRGMAVLREAMTSYRAGSAGSLSQLEEDVDEALRLLGLARPVLNPVLLPEGIPTKVDLFWQQHRLCVEVDGTATHRRPRTIRRDRLRDERLQRAGFMTLRVAEDAFRRHPERAHAEVIRVLRAPMLNP